MTPEDLLTGLREVTAPTAALKRRIEKSIDQRIKAESPLLETLREEVSPSNGLQQTIWSRMLPSVELPQADTFTRIKVALTASEEFKERVKLQVIRSLEPVQVVARGPIALKWLAALALVALFVRLSPILFIASPTVAETEALLVPTRGEIAVSIGGMWQTVEREMALEPGMMLRTHDGEASIILHDDGVVRLDKETTVRLQDVSDRLEPASEILPSLTLFTGRIWVQGLVPSQMRGVSVKTTHGLITVNEGSVSIAEDDYVDVDVYDRSVAVYKDGEPTFLAAGERTRLYEDNVLLVKKVPAKWYQYTWADQNLKRDAVHRHDIAQMQHERRIAQAGILPTSPLYPVKRFAELMHVWLTWDQQTRVEKQLQVAETRLNEAAALIYEGHDADIALEDYKQILESIANGESHGSLSEFLVQRALAESTAQISAALPGDESYVIKKTVLETSAGLSESIAREEDAQGTLLLDGLAVMLKSADEGRTDLVTAVWSDLQPYLRTLENEELALDPAMHKEAQTLLAFLATSLHVASRRGADVDPELLDDIAAYLPAPKEPTVVSLSEEEVMEIVSRIREKIFLYDMTRSRINQFFAEMKALDGHPDQGRILRRLALSLPDGPENFPERVYKEIVKLRWERVGETI